MVERLGRRTCDSLSPVRLPVTTPGASILRGVGRAISHLSKNGGLTDWSFWLHIFDRLLFVALGIPVMPIVNRNYLKLVLLYVNVNSTQLSVAEILTTALG